MTLRHKGAGRRVTTGVPELDAILYGGLPHNRFIVLQGQPGTGKTTLALQYLLEAKAQDERALFITLSQTEQELRRIAHSHGLPLDGIEIYALEPKEVMNHLSQQQDIFPTHEVELAEVAELIRDVVAATGPERLVFDSMSDIRLLAGRSYVYRQQIIALRHLLEQRECTSLIISTVEDGDLQALSDGVITFERYTPDYGDKRYRLNIEKMRGIDFHGGYHDYSIRKGGLEVYPRTVVGSKVAASRELVESGYGALDRLLEGGLERGTACLLLGPSGSGKTVLSTLYSHAAGQRGEHVALFLFDERAHTFLRRAERLNMDLAPFIEDGRITLETIDVGTMSPGEFAHRVERAVAAGAELIVIDSLTGYLAAMPQENLLIAQMHELLAALSQRGVLTLFTVAQHGFASATEDAIDVSYLADTVFLLGYVLERGKLHKTVTVVKKRAGPHDSRIFELLITEEGIRVGEVLELGDGYFRVSR